MALHKTSERVDFAAVKEASLRSLDFIIPWLLPGGKRQGDEWSVRNPTRNDSKPGSFKVNMRTGVWSDFATGESGGDMIDLYTYINGGTNFDAKDALADMLNVQARGDKPVAVAATQKPIVTAAVAESRVAPSVFPPRTKPNEEGRPKFVAGGDEGPRAWNNELRRHIYRQGGVPIRIKIVNKNEAGSKPTAGALNAYRVVDSDGTIGWQFGKPAGFQQVPYTVASADPLTAKIDRIIFWVEGEKDVDTVAGLGGLAFTFGGTGDGLPEGCQQYLVGRNVVILADNDDAGRKHAEEKAALAKPVAISVTVIHFAELADKGDVSDWIESGKTFEDLKERVLAAEFWQPSAKPESEKPEETSHKLPYGFAFTDRGLMYQDSENAESKPLHVAGCFDIEAMTRDGDSGGWGTLLRWKDPDGRDHRYALAHEHLAGDGAEARRILMDQGFYIAPNKAARAQFNSFLLQVKSPNRALRTDRVGWNGPAFVLPDECFGGKPGETMLLQNPTSHELYSGKPARSKSGRRSRASLLATAG